MKNLNLVIYTTEEIRDWQTHLCLCNTLIDADLPLCLAITEELNIRERIYDDINPYTYKQIEELSLYEC